MAGSYCKYCDQRCFVERELPNGSWNGYTRLHMATCPKGMDHDRKRTGYDCRTAHNPHAGRITSNASVPLPSETADMDRLDRAWRLALADADHETQTLAMKDLTDDQLQMVVHAGIDLHEYARTEQDERIRATAGEE